MRINRLDDSLVPFSVNVFMEACEKSLFKEGSSVQIRNDIRVCSSRREEVQSLNGTDEAPCWATQSKQFEVVDVNESLKWSNHFVTLSVLFL